MGVVVVWAVCVCFFLVDFYSFPVICVRLVVLVVLLPYYSLLLLSGPYRSFLLFVVVIGGLLCVGVDAVWCGVPSCVCPF